MPTSRTILLDDRLLIAHLIGAKVAPTRRADLLTTSYWYHRSCRAAMLGGSGQLSGPFAELRPDDQARAIGAMVELPLDISLPDPRVLVPVMVDVSARHPRLNLMNVEAAAAAIVTSARVLLSPPAASGVLVPVLDAEGVRWDVVDATG